MTPVIPMEVETALKHMSIEQAIEYENRRFFCNADEIINTISTWAMKKQIPMKVIKKKYYFVAPCCGKMFEKDYEESDKKLCPKFCSCCGQALDWTTEEVNNA